MKINPESRSTIEKIRLISGTTYDQCKEFFESLITHISLNYLEEKETYIPYIGSFKFIYDGDTIDSEGKEAKIKIEFSADPNLKKIIGQIVDGNEMEIDKMLFKKIRYELEDIADPDAEFRKKLKDTDLKLT
jgi:hypothetical protein